MLHDFIFIKVFVGQIICLMGQYPIPFRVKVTDKFLSLEIHGTGLLEAAKSLSGKMFYSTFIVIMPSIHLLAIHIFF